VNRNGGAVVGIHQDGRETDLGADQAVDLGAVVRRPVVGGPLVERDRAQVDLALRAVLEIHGDELFLLVHAVLPPLLKNIHFATIGKNETGPGWADLKDTTGLPFWCQEALVLPLILSLRRRDAGPTPRRRFA